MDISKLESELLDLENAYKQTRNATEIANLASMIEKKKKEIKEAKEEKIPITNYIQKDAPVRADHNYNGNNKSGYIPTNRESFISII